ncbi:MAG: DNA alkylation repair protein [bacterium]|nr:DNA alkylation repair protein [bacterium]
MTISTTSPFKLHYGANLAELLAAKIVSVYPAFRSDAFVQQVAGGVEALELKGRVHLIRDALRDYLPGDYRDATALLLAILGDELPAEDGMFNLGYWVMPIAAYVQAYGLDHFELSMRALYEITKRYSSEEAIRPYLVRYTDRVMPILHEWTADPSAHVRRLVSEGTRPRLPWAMHLPAFIANPAPVLALLERLKDDPSLYVRRSVANNLNDIAKDNPALVVETVSRWRSGATAERDWLIKHALRHQIKQGNTAALAVLGFNAEHGITAQSFTLSPGRLPIGEPVTLHAALHNPDAVAHAVVVDYVVHFIKAARAGTERTSPKVFKWTTLTLNPGESAPLAKRHAFRDVSVRTHYPGAHRIDLQINGRIAASATVTLAAP